jgi:DNA-binding response OmpR family regulator
MRPPKTILLVGADEDMVSRLKLVLWAYHYAVTSAASADAAIAEFRERQYELLFCLYPLAGVEQLLDQVRASEHPAPSIVYAPELKAYPAGIFADCIVLSNCPRAELLDRVKILSARKRGPRPLRKPVASVLRTAGYQRQCQRMGCRNLIDPKHPSKRFCNDACRQQDGREMRKLKPKRLCDECKKKLRRGEGLKDVAHETPAR